MTLNPISVDIKDILVTDGVGVFAAQTGWGIYIGQEPTGKEGETREGPDTCITIYDVDGDPVDTLNKVRTDDFSIQIRVRGSKEGYTAAYTKIQEVITSLDQKKDHLVTGARYASIYRSTIHRFLKRDDQNRPIWVCNFGGLRAID